MDYQDEYAFHRERRRGKMKKAVKVVGILIIIAIVYFLAEWIDQNNQAEKEKLTEVVKQSTAKEQVQEAVKPESTNNLSESKRKEIFKALLDLQDEYLEKYPDNNEKQQEAYRTIAQKYKISEKKMSEIAVEGAKKGWIYQ
jgi:cytoskeletal protein RodZ